MSTDSPPPKAKPKSYDHAPQLPEGTVDLHSLFDPSLSTGPIMLEIGPGRGRFALEYCDHNPGTRVLALEIRKKLAFQLDQRFLKKKQHSRARCFAEDAREVLPRLQPDASVHAVAVHFPDPWWKHRHQKRMVVGDALIDQLARLVVPGGLILVQTDVRERADEYAAAFATNALFACLGNPFVDESPFAPARSNREALAIEDGLPVFRLVFRRVSS